MKRRVGVKDCFGGYGARFVTVAEMWLLSFELGDHSDASTFHLLSQI